MALRRRGSSGNEGLNAWPGYVDALSTLLMVIIFVLLVFVLAQAFLSVALTGRDRALDRLNRQMSELSDMLALERGRSAELRLSLAQVTRDLQGAAAARDQLTQQVAGLRDEQTRLTADRDALRADHDQLAARLADAALQTQAAQSRAEDLTAQLAEAAKRTEAQGQETAAVAVQLAEVRRQLAARTADLAQARQQMADTATKIDASTRDIAARTAAADQLRQQLADSAARMDATAQDLVARTGQLAEASRRADTTAADLAAARQQLQAVQAQLAEMRGQAAELDAARQVDRTTVEARVSDMAKLAEQVRALTALRDELDRQAREAASRATTEAQAREAAVVQAMEEKRLGDSARAQLALLNRQVDELRAQMEGVQKALDLAQVSVRDKDVKIADLGSQLNVALARKVEELQRYRSEFFGKLREVLANRPGIQIVGDRFVFQSEVLFPVGSADMTAAGVEQINKLADTLKKISTEIPKEVAWVLRVDGHADRQKIEAGRWGSNWELSAGRAITVIKLLVANGIPPARLAATGFADNQPLDPADTPEAYARNRRIEIRLTDR